MSRDTKHNKDTRKKLNQKVKIPQLWRESKISQQMRFFDVSALALAVQREEKQRRDPMPR